MTNVKHTPGPWEWSDDGNGNCWGRAGLKPCVLSATVHGLVYVDDADARLIAAAPDLLEALRDALWALDNAAAVLSANGIQSTLTDPRPQMRAAIAKAEGRDK